MKYVLALFLTVFAGSEVFAAFSLQSSIADEKWGYVENILLRADLETGKYYHEFEPAELNDGLSSTLRALRKETTVKKLHVVEAFLLRQASTDAFFQLEQSERIDLLSDAAHFGCLRLVEALYDDLKGNKHATGRALSHGVYGRHREIVEFLLENGAPVNGEPGSAQNLPIVLAAKGGDPIIFRQLLSYGASLEHKQKNEEGRWVSAWEEIEPLLAKNFQLRHEAIGFYRKGRLEHNQSLSARFEELHLADLLRVNKGLAPLKTPVATEERQTPNCLDDFVLIQ